MTTEVTTPEPEAVAAPAVPVSPVASVAAVDPNAPAARPEGLADDYWDAETNTVKPTAFARLAELEAAAQARAADVPADAAGYKLEPATPIEGFEFKADDPLAVMLVSAAAKHAVPQGFVSDILADYAQAEIAQAKADADTIAAEIQKLGANHGARVAAVRTAVAGATDATKAEALLSKLSDAASFEVLEALIRKASGPTVSAAPAPQADADLDGLTGEARLHAIRARAG